MVVHCKKITGKIWHIDEFHGRCKMGRNIFHTREKNLVKKGERNFFHIMKDAPTFFHTREINLLKIFLFSMRD